MRIFLYSRLKAFKDDKRWIENNPCFHALNARRLVCYMERKIGIKTCKLVVTLFDYAFHLWFGNWRAKLYSGTYWKSELLKMYTLPLYMTCFQILLEHNCFHHKTEHLINNAYNYDLYIINHMLNFIIKLTPINVKLRDISYKWIVFVLCSSVGICNKWISLWTPALWLVGLGVQPTWGEIELFFSSSRYLYRASHKHGSFECLTQCPREWDWNYADLSLYWSKI